MLYSPLLSLKTSDTVVLIAVPIIKQTSTQPQPQGVRLCFGSGMKGGSAN